MAKHAFLVDDSKSARIVLGRLLKKNGFDEVETAESGEQALEKLKELSPDAIFVDFLMDGIDGLETISEIKKDARFTNTPVVMCTANEGDRYVQAAVEHGALGILAKPPTDDSLKEIIQLIESGHPMGQEQPLPATAGDAVQAVIPEERIRTIAMEAATAAARTTAATIAQEQADAIAREATRETLNEMLEPLVAALVVKRLETSRPPEVNTDSLREKVVAQVNNHLEEFVRQLNERSMGEMVEARIYEQMQELANDFSLRLLELKESILAQVPEKNDMIEHIRMVTEGAMEAQVREISTHVSQEVANTVATETVEQILDEQLADRMDSKSTSKTGKSAGIIFWLGLLLAGGALGYAAYFFKLLP